MHTLCQTVCPIVPLLVARWEECFWGGVLSLRVGGRGIRRARMGETEWASGGLGGALGGSSCMGLHLVFGDVYIKAENRLVIIAFSP